VPFAFAIAVLKDVPDARGDERFGIRTWTVRRGPATALRLGLAALTLAGAGMAVAGLVLLPVVPGVVVAVLHLGAVAWLWARARALDLADHPAVVGFYQGVWRLFFAEVVVVPLAFLA
jgi:homogentisate phytyltransferase/homogentisate geranylgeranyltransferase